MVAGMTRHTLLKTTALPLSAATAPSLARYPWAWHA